jgi:hypothetical protein
VALPPPDELLLDEAPEELDELAEAPEELLPVAPEELDELVAAPEELLLVAAAEELDALVCPEELDALVCPEELDELATALLPPEELELEFPDDDDAPELVELDEVEPPPPELEGSVDEQLAAASRPTVGTKSRKDRQTFIRSLPQGIAARVSCARGRQRTTSVVLFGAPGHNFSRAGRVAVTTA